MSLEILKVQENNGSFQPVSRLLKLLWFLGICILVGFVIFRSLDFFFPLPEVAESRPFSQIVVDRYGRPLRAFADENGVWRYPTSMSNVSPHYLTALINYEDRQFWRHQGINPFSMVRALWQRLKNGRWISGGSTLTMQVARILDPHQKNLSGKLWQMFRATQLEYHLSKEEILTLYLNYAPFGGPIEGVEAAAYTYLGKSASDLSLSESALLAVLPQSPSRFRPDRHHQRAEKARNKVIKRLVCYGIWTSDEAKLAMEEAVYAEFNSRPMIAPLLARQLAKRYSDQTLIKTTVDLDVQQPIADLVKQYSMRFSETTTAAAVVLENRSLNVLAYVGTAEFGNLKRFGHIDMNRAIRSPGSTLKPFIYGMGLDEGLIHSESLLQDVPLEFGGYTPQNFTRSFSGPVSVSQSLQQSLNIPAVQLLSHLGPEKFAAGLEHAGVSLSIPGNANPSLSLALGGVGVRLIDLVGAYRSFAVDGMAGKPKYRPNEPIEERFLLSKESSWIIGDMLAALPLESARRNRFLKKPKRWLAHKTGTSYGHRDAWMIAVTPEHTIGVWIGKPDGTPSPGEFGRKTAAPLVKRISQLLPNQISESPQKPDRVSQAEICWPLGTAVSVSKQQHCHWKKTAYLIDDIAPPTLVEQSAIQSNPLNIIVAASGGQRVLAKCFEGLTEPKQIALWPPRLELWLPAEYRREAIVPAYHSDCARHLKLTDSLNVIGVNNNDVLSVPPNSHDKMELTLSVSTSHEKLTWLVNGRLLGTTENSDSILLSELTAGEFNVMVFSSQGKFGQVSFKVM